jgi:hypothetical protein
MRRYRFFAIPLIMLLLLACGLTNGISGIATQLPGILTSVPTALGAVETLSSQQSSSNCPATPAAIGLGISLDQIKTILEATQQFVFTDGTVNGKPASTATLGPTLTASFPDIATGFSAQFIGDPCNISELTISLPRNDQQTTVDQAVGLIDVLIAAFLPSGDQLAVINWMTQNYGTVPVGGQAQTTQGSMQFTLTRSSTEMVLDIVPAK